MCKSRTARHLHSFPTRRSSDLARLQHEAAAIQRRQEPDFRVRVELGRLVVHLPGEPRGVRVRRDRKSTRLNSSHGYNSYAVFCLKKKKNKIDNVYETTNALNHT